MTSLTSSYAARTLKQIMELRAQGATWDDVAHVMKIENTKPGERAKKAKKLAKEAARVTQKVLAEQGIGLS